MTKKFGNYQSIITFEDDIIARGMHDWAAFHYSRKFVKLTMLALNVHAGDDKKSEKSYLHSGRVPAWYSPLWTNFTGIICTFEGYLSWLWKDVPIEFWTLVGLAKSNRARLQAMPGRLRQEGILMKWHRSPVLSSLTVTLFCWKCVHHLLPERPMSALPTLCNYVQLHRIVQND